jgi:chlorite dismutase
VTDRVFVHVLALGLAAEWRREDAARRVADMASFCDAERRAADDRVRSLLYSSVGLEPGVDVVLWRTADSVDALEAAAARLLRSGLGGWLTVRDSFIGRTGGSQYVATPTDQETGLLEGDRGRYLIVYPFTKASEWYLLSREARQGVMNEHMRVGRAFPTVRQALAYSFGLDDQDFIVAYETDDLAAFGELVRELRGTESRRSTVNDTPILLAIRRSLDELGTLIGAGS